MRKQTKKTYALFLMSLLLAPMAQGMENIMPPSDTIKSFEDIWSKDYLSEAALKAPLHLYLSMLPTLLENPEMKERLLAPITKMVAEFTHEMENAKDGVSKIRNQIIVNTLKKVLHFWTEGKVESFNQQIEEIKNNPDLLKEIGENIQKKGNKGINDVKEKLENMLNQEEDEGEQLQPKAKGLFADAKAKLKAIKHQFTQTPEFIAIKKNLADVQKAAKEAAEDVQKAAKEAAEEFAQKAKATLAEMATRAAEEALTVDLGVIESITLEEALRAYATSERVMARKTHQQHCPVKMNVKEAKIYLEKRIDFGNKNIPGLAAAIENSIPRAFGNANPKNAAIVDAKDTGECRYMFRQRQKNTLGQPLPYNPYVYYFTYDIKNK